MTWHFSSEIPLCLEKEPRPDVYPEYVKEMNEQSLTLMRFNRTKP